MFCGTTRPNTKRQNAESDRSRRFSFPGQFSQCFHHFRASAPTRQQLSVRRKNDCAPERDPQVSPGTPEIKVSNSHTLRSTAAKSEQPVFSGGASETVAESADELTEFRRWKQHIHCRQNQQARCHQSGGVRVWTQFSRARRSLFFVRSSDSAQLSSWAVLHSPVVASRVYGRGRLESSTAVARLGCRLNFISPDEAGFGRTAHPLEAAGVCHDDSQIVDGRSTVGIKETCQSVNRTNARQETRPVSEPDTRRKAEND